MIKYFRKGLKTSISVEIEKRGCKFNSFEELVEKTINAKAKTTPKPCFYAQKTEQHCSRDRHLVHSTTTKDESQSSFIKDPRAKKFRRKPQEPKLLAL